MVALVDDERAGIPGRGEGAAVTLHHDLIFEPGHPDRAVVDEAVEAGVDDDAAGMGGRAPVPLDALADGARDGGRGERPEGQHARRGNRGVRDGADRRIDPVRTDEVDRLESGEERNVVAWRDATVELGRLDDERAYRRPVDVGDDVVVAQDVAIARGVLDEAAEGSGAVDVGQADRGATTRGAVVRGLSGPESGRGDDLGGDVVERRNDTGRGLVPLVEIQPDRSVGQSDPRQRGMDAACAPPGRGVLGQQDEAAVVRKGGLFRVDEQLRGHLWPARFPVRCGGA